MNKNDYIKILEFYKKTIPKNKTQLKIQAEKILSEKLCRCIKKLDPVNEARSIGICTKTILNNKGFERGKFSCKKKQHVTFRKYNKSSKNNKKNKTRKEKR
jgi:hypothetical protein